jgi:N-acetylglucosamine kinase-like BadF-type ATPase
VARSVDGRGPETRLQQALIDFIELEKVEELIVWAHDATKADIAGLVPVVVEQARAADAVAGEILVKAVEELEGHVLTLLENLGPWQDAPRVALAGGLLEPGGPLREATERVLTRHQLIRVDFQPHAIRGAVGLARQLLAGER